MKKELPPEIEIYRKPHPASGLIPKKGDIQGYFQIPVFDINQIMRRFQGTFPKKKDLQKFMKNRMLTVMSGCGLGWDHISASMINRCPNWEEMCMLKNIFWEPEELVIQYHPPESQYVRDHEFCLHLWKPWDVEIPLPPKHFVG